MLKTAMMTRCKNN